jgi:hypothetical protein
MGPALLNVWGEHMSPSAEHAQIKLILKVSCMLEDFLDVNKNLDFLSCWVTGNVPSTHVVLRPTVFVRCTAQQYDWTSIIRRDH